MSIVRPMIRIPANPDLLGQLYTKAGERTTQDREDLAMQEYDTAHTVYCYIDIVVSWSGISLVYISCTTHGKASLTY